MLLLIVGDPVWIIVLSPPFPTAKLFPLLDFEDLSPEKWAQFWKGLILLRLQSRFGDKPVILKVVCPQNGTAVIKLRAKFNPKRPVSCVLCTRYTYYTSVSTPIARCLWQRQSEQVKKKTGGGRSNRQHTHPLLPLLPDTGIVCISPEYQIRIVGTW